MNPPNQGIVTTAASKAPDASKQAGTVTPTSGHHPTPKNASQPGFGPPALTKSQCQRLTRWGIRHRGLIKACWAGTATKRQAIQGFCLECCGEDAQSVAECGDRCCPLWRYRPYQPKGASPTTKTTEVPQ